MTFVDSTGKDLSRGATEKRAWVSGGRRARLLREFAVSGLCAARFAKLVGVKPVTFYAWLRKQKAARTEVPGNQHQRPVPLVEAVFDLPSNLRGNPRAPLVVHLCGGSRAEVTSVEGVRLLAQLVQDLSSCTAKH